MRVKGQPGCYSRAGKGRGPSCTEAAELMVRSAPGHGLCPPALPRPVVAQVDRQFQRSRMPVLGPGRYSPT